MTTIKTALEPVKFEHEPEAGHVISWQVTMNEDGSLSIYPTGRRPGRIHVIPCSHTSIIVTTDQIPR